MNILDFFRCLWMFLGLGNQRFLLNFNFRVKVHLNSCCFIKFQSFPFFLIVFYEIGMGYRAITVFTLRNLLNRISLIVTFEIFYYLMIIFLQINKMTKTHIYNENVNKSKVFKKS